jgi:hypothetical protein
VKNSVVNNLNNLKEIHKGHNHKLGRWYLYKKGDSHEISTLILSLCRELRKREETMDQFLATFQETKDEELQRLSNLRNFF